MSNKKRAYVIDFQVETAFVEFLFGEESPDEIENDLRVQQNTAADVVAAC